MDPLPLVDAADPAIPEGLTPLSPNPGGIGDPAAMVGREVELARLHEAIAAGGAHVIGERRMGKTWLVKRLQDDLAATVTAIYVSAETDRLDLFAGRLLTALRANRVVGKNVAKWEKELGGELRLEFGAAGLTLTGKARKPAVTPEVPTGIDVLSLLQPQGGSPIVLIIDEITHLCHALGPDMATEFLSALRSGRQSGGPPLVICGSIGLHHALDDLTPVNDLWTVEVGALQRQEAVTLAARLLMGIGMTPTPRLVGDILRETSAIPFYVQAVVDRLRYEEGSNVAAVVRACISGNVWHTDHYDARLDEYYGSREAPRARAVLDVVATSPGPVTVDEALARVATRDPDTVVTRDEMLRLVTKLEKDHYLVRRGNADEMSSPLLATIWRHHRRLS